MSGIRVPPPLPMIPTSYQDSREFPAQEGSRWVIIGFSFRNEIGSHSQRLSGNRATLTPRSKSQPVSRPRIPHSQADQSPQREGGGEFPPRPPPHEDADVGGPARFFRREIHFTVWAESSLSLRLARTAGILNRRAHLQLAHQVMHREVNHLGLLIELRVCGAQNGRERRLRRAYCELNTLRNCADLSYHFPPRMGPGPCQHPQSRPPLNSRPPTKSTCSSTSTR